MRIVGESLQNSTLARKTGYGSHDIMDRVKNFTSLESATTDLELTVGTTSKQRIKRYDAHHPTAIGSMLDSKSGILQQVGLVFGSEENGLSTDQLDCCDLVSTIPLDTEYPSLNLAQSVLIYAWELSKTQPQTEVPSHQNPNLQQILMDEVQSLLGQLSILDKPLLTRRILDRIALLNTDDSQLLMSVLTRLNRKS